MIQITKTVPRIGLAIIEVTADNIAFGERASCKRCPVAFAIQRVLKRTCVVEVHADCAWLRHLCQTAQTGVDLPDEAIDFIEAFDTRRIVKPFAFALRIPVEFLREGATCS